MHTVTTFDPAFEGLLPETYKIIQASNLVVHDAVAQIFLVGSRGLAGSNRIDSDIDLSLMINRQQLPEHDPDRALLLRNVLEITLNHWRGPVETDLAAVFDIGQCCGLKCFQTGNYDPDVIRGRGVDCFGVYKIQRGFDGYVTQGVQIAKMYPILTLWQRT